MKVVVIAAAPALAALLLWAILDLENFVLFAVLGTIVFPASLAKPFGTNVDAADILLAVALAAWLVTNSLMRIRFRQVWVLCCVDGSSGLPWLDHGVPGPLRD